MRRNDAEQAFGSLLPLAGGAVLLALSGCAAVPVMNMASHIMTQGPNPVASSGAAAQPGLPPPDMLAALAQRMGLELPGHAAGLPAAPATASSPAAASQPTQ